MKHFLDTFALVEILNGNPAYSSLIHEAGTSLFHLYELHVQVSRLRDEASADVTFGDLRLLCVDVLDADIQAASRFKRAHARKRFSYVDALGYAMAKERNVPLVTGDRAFRGMEGILFLPRHA